MRATSCRASAMPMLGAWASRHRHHLFPPTCFISLCSWMMPSAILRQSFMLSLLTSGARHSMSDGLDFSAVVIKASAQGDDDRPERSQDDQTEDDLNDVLGDLHGRGSSLCWDYGLLQLVQVDVAKYLLWYTR